MELSLRLLGFALLCSPMALVATESSDHSHKPGFAGSHALHSARGTDDPSVSSSDRIDGDLPVVMPRDGGPLHRMVPELELDSMDLSETSGDGDGRWEPGETIQLSIGLVNRGSVNAHNVTGILSFMEPPPTGVRITESSGTWPIVFADGSPRQIDPPGFQLEADGAVGMRPKLRLQLEVFLDGDLEDVFDIPLSLHTFSEPILEWSHEAKPPFASFYLSPRVIQLTDDNGDGRITECDVPDVVLLGANQMFADRPTTVFALSGDGSGLLWEYSDPYCDPAPGIAVGDIDNDGWNEVVFATWDLRLCALNSNGGLKWRSDPVESASGEWIPVVAHPDLWDLDGDGTVEVVRPFAVYRGSDGSKLWNQDPLGVWTLSSLVVDLDLDGSQEIILSPGRTFSASGMELSTVFPEFGTPGSWSTGMVGNLDDDPWPEILSSPDLSSIAIHDHDGNPRPASGHVGFAPSERCLADVDDDGYAEIGIAPDESFLMLDEDGSVLWETPLGDDENWSGCVFFDFEGDGALEVVFRTDPEVLVLDARDGEILSRIENFSGTAGDYPIVADVDRDGSAEILVVGKRPNVHRELGFHVYGNPAWVGARGIWNQENYSVNHVMEDGAIVPSPFPRWLDGNDFRAQAVSCGCEGPTGSIRFHLSDCAPDSMVPPGSSEFLVCFESEHIRAKAPVEFRWDPGDGSPPIAGETACHEYGSEGDYWVRLDGTDASGCTWSVRQRFKLRRRPRASYVSEEACQGNPVCVTASIENGLEPFDLVWDWGDGQSTPHALSSCHQFASSGNYSVALRVRDSLGCESSAMENLVMGDPPDLREVSGAGALERLKVRRVGQNLAFTYEDTGKETGLYSGELRRLMLEGYTHAATSTCRAQGRETQLTMAPGNLYFLAVASDCDDPRAEGPYGFDSNGSPRPSARELGTTTCP